MGTSQSSNGAPSGVPLIPPWVPPLLPSESDIPSSQDNISSNQTTDQPSQVSELGRFGPVRRILGSYANTGDISSLHRGLGYYVSRGLGGSHAATRRFGGTVSSAKGLFSALAGFRQGESLPGVDFADLKGKSGEELIRAVVNTLQPINGTQDAEASRDAMNKSLTELLVKFPEADLLNLEEEQIFLITESFVAQDIFNRIYLDIGKTLQTKAGSPIVAAIRRKEMKSYIKQVVAAEMRKLKPSGATELGKNIGRIVQRAIQYTLDVFEEYVK